MSATKNRFLAIALCSGIVSAFYPVNLCSAMPSGQQTQQAPATNRRIGAVKAISSTSITLTSDAGSDVTVTIQTTTRLVRIAPGEKDLKNAAPIQLQDVQVGDRILVGGKLSDDGQSFVASSVVAMKRSDLEAKHEQDLQDWQRRGVDGLAKSVDHAAETVTISVRSKDVVIRVSGSTEIRRYAPDSVKFDDARSSTLQEIHPGDQVRARGERSADGGELAAVEIVTGTFPLLAGTVNSADTGSWTVSVHDLSSKKTVLVKITQDSQLHQLSPEMAQRIAARLKGAAAGAVGTGPAGNAHPQGADPNSSGASAVGGMPTRSGRAGGADLQAILSRAPAIALTDLHKGDAVVILSTEGSGGSGTAITLFSGVEAILQAAPNAAQAMMLAPWSLGAPSGDLGGP
jgi:hypothetical protein